MSILLDFRDKIAVFDFCDIAYCTVPKQGNAYTIEGKRRSERNITQVLPKYVIEGSLSSNKKINDLFIRVTLLMAKLSHNLHEFQLEGMWPESIRFGPIHKGDEKLSESIELGMVKAGYQSCCEYYSHQLVEGSIGFFWIHSALSEAELKAKLSQPWVIQNLDLIHFYLSNAYPERTNPHIINGFFKQKTIAVLKLTAQGMSSKAIGEQLHLTSRGVNYHIEQAKAQLGAKNKAELVSSAKNCFLL